MLLLLQVNNVIAYVQEPRSWMRCRNSGLSIQLLEVERILLARGAGVAAGKRLEFKVTFSR
jgi:hypothetical protein